MASKRSVSDQTVSRDLQNAPRRRKRRRRREAIERERQLSPAKLSSTAGRLKRPTTLFNAARAAARLRRTFDDWMAIGLAVQRIDAMNKNEHGLIDYKAVGRRLTAEKIAPPVGVIDILHLRRIMRHYDKVLSWHAALPVDFQILWCAPSTIIRHCPVFTAQPKPPRIVGT